MRPFPLVVLLLAAGCDPGPAKLPPFVVSDSAGVEIVWTRADPGSRVAGSADAGSSVPEAGPSLPEARPSPPEARPSGLLSLPDAPLLRLGSEEEESPELFGQINSLHLSPDGSLWVTDLTTAEIRVFTVPHGEHRFTVGGRGEGPGEFGLPMPVGFDGEGRAWIWDQQLGRLTIFTPDGHWVEFRSIETPGGLIPRLIQRLPDGTFLARLPEPFAGPVRDGMTLEDPLRLWRIDAAGGEPKLVVERDGPLWYYRDGIQTPLPFSEGAHAGARGDLLVLTDPTGEPVLEVFEAGAQVRRIHLDRAREPLTAEALERELAGGRRSDAAADLLRGRLAELTLPESVPTWAWIRLGPRGHILALQHGTLLSGEMWDVFQPDGRFSGTLSLEGSRHLMDVGEGRLAVLELDGLGVPGVAVYAFDLER